MTFNGNGSALGGLPVWVRGIATVGAPVMFAAWLLYFMTAVQGSKLDAIEVANAQIISVNSEIRLEIRDYLRLHAEETRTLHTILQQICANGAADKAERDACFPGREKK
jgi:hypothetical protein